MTEQPILYTGEMVRAYLADRKTRTSRVITARNSICAARIADLDLSAGRFDPGPSPAGNPGPYLKAPHKSDGTVHRVYPRVQPGDVLWIRETYARIPGDDIPLHRIHYLADGPIPSVAERHDAGLLKVYPSIYMPRWACRAVQTVLTVGGQRVQYIVSDQYKLDIFHEGICEICDHPGVRYSHDDPPDYCGDMGGRGCFIDSDDLFRTLWDSINGKRPGCSWADNPPVWIYGYAPHSQERGRP